MNILKVLKQEHKEVAELFEAIEKTSERGLKKKEQLFDELYENLNAHALGEEKVVYPRMKQEEDAEDMILEAYEEHGIAKRLLKELYSLNITDERWMAKISVLKEMIEHHVEEEEKELFKQMKKALNTEELEKLGEEYLAFKETIISRGTKKAA